MDPQYNNNMIIKIISKQHNQSTKGWQSGLSSRAPAQQVQGPEFKPHYSKIIIITII
jgi:hypothetical protein